MSVTIFCDGACSPNPGLGGWAAVIIFHGVRSEIHGAEPNTTNNRMEQLAAIKALEALPGREQVKLYTDSSYLCNAFKQGWLKNWLRNGWENSQGKPVLNKDLWERLHALNTLHQIDWTWIKGHGTNEEHNRCDFLAVEARLSLK